MDREQPEMRSRHTPEGKAGPEHAGPVTGSGFARSAAGLQPIARCALAALTMLWAGVLIGVSFLAAPAKFAASSLTLPVAMDVGRQEFGALNLAEIALVIVTLALAAYARPERTVWLGLGLAAVIVLLQSVWLLPVLDARAELIMQGETPERAPWHMLYVGAEVVKLLLLLVVGWLALWRPRSG
jgi:hypothetical protein